MSPSRRRASALGSQPSPNRQAGIEGENSQVPGATMRRSPFTASSPGDARTQADTHFGRRPSSATIRCQSCQRTPAKWRDILTNPGKSRWVWQFISLYVERVRAFTNPATRRPVTPEVAGSSPVILAEHHPWRIRDWPGWLAEALARICPSESDRDRRSRPAQSLGAIV